MPTLSRDHRRLLENTVAQARAIAVDGARKVLTDQYAVHHHEPWPHMQSEERELRNQLRAHGRQLGDRRDERRDTQEIEHLVQACAYEHWHRMLFARFLAENDLLLDADHGVAMSLDEVRELAREQNRDWLEIAAELAQKMLLAVFRPDDPVLRVSLPPETRQDLEEKLEALPAPVFQADDSLGWVYQFWQRDEKDRVNKSEVKIGADELPAVTQLFTEDYMVLFLLENTLGSWWTAKRRTEGKDTALPGYEWTYLRLNDDGSPAAGSFDGWPRAARDLKVLDPCMGSGHFLVFALPIIARMRMEEEGLSLRDGTTAVLRDNLCGLELDARCAQIAAFNLALAAWRFAGQHFPLPQLNLACSGLGIHASETDWVKLAGDDGFAREEMRRLYSLFRDAPTLGSLVDPIRLRATVFTSGSQRVLPLIEEALRQEQSDEARELAIAAQGVLAAFRILASRFALVATNVPYLGRGKQDVVLAEYCAEFHGDAKADLATCFIDRCLRISREGGTVALVTPQNWLYQQHYRHFRHRLLESETWCFLARLGPGAFETISGEVVQASLVCLSHKHSSEGSSFAAWDASEERSPATKAECLRAVDPIVLTQSSQLTSQDSRIIFQSVDSRMVLGHFATALSGMSAGDSLRFDRYFWEVPERGADWEFVQTTVDETTFYGGRTGIILWENEQGQIYRLAQSVRHLNHAAQNWLRGKPNWGKPGVVVSQTGDLPVTLYHGDRYDLNCCAIVPHDPSHLPALWAFCSSPEFPRAVRNIDQALKVTPKSLLSVPFDLQRWTNVAAKSFPLGLPAPYCDDPTQWLFSGNPKGARFPLQVAVARLVGYKWPRQLGSSFPDYPALGGDGLEHHADSDGIVCLSSLAGEASAADRLRFLLADAYGEDWSSTTLSSLIGGCESIEVWLRDRFFDEHCQVFRQHPFVWHIWDGRKDGFHALVNYHRLCAPRGEGRKTLEKLIYTALGDWISRQQSGVDRGVEGADGRLTAALHLKAQLESVLAGDRPYDIFVRWKSVAEQSLGWDPDLADGVRLNLRPWLLTGVAPSTRSKKDTCVLRVRPRVSFGKDRGKEQLSSKDEFPWFWSWDEKTDDFLGGDDFDGARWNDLHYSLDTKRKARERRKQAGTNA
ncbi:MAG: hypothetical protein OZ929_21480 [Bryobacterales bacterium]|nr:hypothetical protein [Bryobacterales bacterium]